MSFFETVILGMVGFQEREEDTKIKRSILDKEASLKMPEEAGVQMKWALLPHTSRVILMPFLTVRDTLTLDVAVSETEEREHLMKVYTGLRLPGFDEHTFKSESDFEGIRWARWRGIELRHLKVEYLGERNVDRVLWKLVMNQNALAGFFAQQSDATEIQAKENEAKSDHFARSTLTTAARFGMVEVVRSLCDRGADVNMVDTSGFTPLYMASWFDHVDVVEELLARGAHPDAVNAVFGWSAIYVAGVRQGYETIRTLLEAGANIDTVSQRGESPLFANAQVGNLPMVKFLLKNGANANKVNHEGMSPLAIAQYYQHPAVADLLSKAGAKESSTPLYNALQTNIQLETTQSTGTPLIDYGANPTPDNLVNLSVPWENIEMQPPTLYNGLPTTPLYDDGWDSDEMPSLVEVVDSEEL